ncbi:MAG TPA: fibronectin type III domain-containing protein, partial [Humisphaera sp.]
MIESLEVRQLLCGYHDVPAALASASLGTTPAVNADIALSGPQQAGTTSTTTTTGTVAAAPVPVSAVPAYDSLPSASKRIYLDFNGASGGSWGSFTVTTTPAYDTDGDATTFSDTEQSNIRSIWSRVAEKYAPFNIDVTTVDPGTYASGQTLRAVIGGAGAWMGGGAGGIGYVDSFSSVYSAKNTVWVFPKNLANGTPKYVAEAAAHELGHGFGLDHQSVYSSTGTLVDEYNPGTAAAAPIMGDSYDATRGLWWKGPTVESSTTIQDDMAVIARSANGFGYRPDEAGDTVDAAATPTLSGTSLTAAGVIAKTSDVDQYAFTTGAGTVSFAGSVISAGATLNLKLSLYQADGTLVASADTSALGETLSATVPAGDYRIAVASHGTYGDVGQYTLAGTLVTPEPPPVPPPPVVPPPPPPPPPPPVVVETILAPTGLAAASAGVDSVGVAWTDNSTNEAGFAVERSTDSGFTAATSFQIAPDVRNFTDTGLASGTTYYYRVRAFTATGLNSDYSNVAWATTDVPLPPPPPPPPPVVVLPDAPT